MKIALVLPSVRGNRVCQRIATYVEKQLKERQHETIVIDPLEFKLGLVEMPSHWYEDKSKIPANVQLLQSKISAAEAFVFLTGEYNRTIPPPLSNMLDHCCPLLFAYKAGGIISYSQGPTAGTIAGSHLRDHLLELGCVLTPDMATLPLVQNTFEEDGTLKECDNATHAASGIGRVIDQVAYVGAALLNHRNNSSITPPKLHGYI